MLRRTPSLARRASLIFMSVYAAILLAILALNAALSWADRGGGNLRGPGLAVEYAAGDLRQVEGRLHLRTDGRFAGLAARNPSMWLMVVEDGRTFTFGTVPEAAGRTIAHLRTAVGPVMFRLPGVDTPLGAVSLQRRELPSGPALMASGGVDPVTLTAAESIDILLDPAVPLMLAVIAVISLLAMPIAIPSFTRALRPITVEAGAIGPLEPGRRLDEKKAPKELLPLVRGFNEALQRLDLELGRRKRFIADVAHELRTPLAVVSLRVDSLVHEEGKADLQRGLRGLTHLVSQMLDLERLSLSSRQWGQVDLVATARDIVADLAPMAIERGYELSLVAPNAPVAVSGDGHAIARAVTNLIGNSIVHGGCSGQITVSVGEDRTLDVTDEGPGVPPASHARLFEPFFRGSSDVEGCGLGLHIVSEIMAAHGGEASLVPSPRGAAFRLSFPPPRKES
ncbi:MAG TPA: HAMP domain-containing sensor histidine kinase [Allosphingosinicella sp.]|jgi:signal transduction histidine kinase